MQVSVEIAGQQCQAAVGVLFYNVVLDVRAFVDGRAAVRKDQDGEFFERVVFGRLGRGFPGNFVLGDERDAFEEEGDAVHACVGGGGGGYEGEGFRRHGGVTGVACGLAWFEWLWCLLGDANSYSEG